MKMIASLFCVFLLAVFLLPGFVFMMIGFYLIMLFFWLGEHAGVVRPGTYNQKHLVLGNILKWVRDLTSLHSVFIKFGNH